MSSTKTPSTEASAPTLHTETRASNMSSTETPPTEASVPTLHTETQAPNKSSSKPPSTTESPTTLYDETHRGIWHIEPGIRSMANSPSLIAHLEHHEPTTDGSFALCIADGTGNFIRKDLYESIPEEHRPKLNKGTHHVALFGSREGQTASGTAFIPVLLKNAETGERFRIVLHAYVLPKLLMGMFISNPWWHKYWGLGPDGRNYGFDFGDGEIVVKGA